MEAGAAAENAMPSTITFCGGARRGRGRREVKGVREEGRSRNTDQPLGRSTPDPGTATRPHFAAAGISRTSRGHLEDISRASRGHLEGISRRGAWAPRCSSSRSAAPSSSRACAGAGPRRRRARAPPRSRTPPLRRRRCCSTPLGGGGGGSHHTRVCAACDADGCERGWGACEAVSWGKAHSSRVASGCSACESAMESTGRVSEEWW